VTSICNTCAIDALETDGFDDDDTMLTSLLEDLEDDDEADDPLNLPTRRKPQ